MSRDRFNPDLGCRKCGSMNLQIKYKAEYKYSEYGGRDGLASEDLEIKCERCGYLTIEKPVDYVPALPKKTKKR